MGNQRTVLVFAVVITLLTSSLPATAAQMYEGNFAATNNPGISNPPTLQQEVDPTISEIPVTQNNSEPLAINVDSGGHVWFAESFLHEIVEYMPPTGTFRNFPIPTNSSNVGLIWFIIFDNAGNAWFSIASQPLLWRLSPTTGQFANFSTGSSLVDPYAIAYDSSTNRIWFTSIYTGQIGVFEIYPNESASLLKLVSVPDPSGSFQTSSSGPIIGASGIALDSRGNLFLSESFASAIIEYNPSSSTFIRVWKLPQGSSPVGLAVDEMRGRIWFTNHATSNFGYVVESTGHVIQISTSLFSFSTVGGSDTITLPYWISISPQGLIWFDEHYGNKIARFDPDTLQLTEFLVPTVASSPLRFVLDNSRGLVWFTEFSGNNIGVLSQNDSISAKVSVSLSSAILSSSAFSVSVNYKNPNGSNSQVFSPLVSGTPSFDGHLDSNLSISFQNVNSTDYKISFNRGKELASGNYTLTICPRFSNNDSETSPPPTRQCAIIFLTVDSEGFYGLNQIDSYIIAVVVIAIVISISLLYVKRWRGT